MDKTVFTSKNIKSLNAMCPAATSVQMGNTLKEMDLKIKSRIPTEVSNTTELKNENPDLFVMGTVITSLLLVDEEKEVECCAELICNDTEGTYKLYVSTDEKNWTLKLDFPLLTGFNARINVVKRQGRKQIVLSALECPSIYFVDLVVHSGILDYGSTSVNVITEGFINRIFIENNEIFSVQQVQRYTYCYHLNENNVWDKLQFSPDVIIAEVKGIVYNGNSYVFFMLEADTVAQKLVTKAYRTIDFQSFEILPVGDMVENFDSFAYNKVYLGLSGGRSKPQIYFSYDLKNWHLSYDFGEDTAVCGILSLGSETGVVISYLGDFSSLYLYTTLDFIKWEKKEIVTLDLESYFGRIYAFGKIDENLQAKIVVTTSVSNIDYDSSFVAYFSTSNGTFLPMGYEPNNTAYYSVYSTNDKVFFLSNYKSPSSKMNMVLKNGTYVQNDGFGVFKYLEDGTVKIGISSVTSLSGKLKVNVDNMWISCKGEDDTDLPTNFVDIKIPKVHHTSFGIYRYIAITDNGDIYASANGNIWYLYISLGSDIEYLLFDELHGKLFFNKKGDTTSSYFYNFDEMYPDFYMEGLQIPYGKWCALDVKNDTSYLGSFDSTHKLLSILWKNGDFSANIVSIYKNYGCSQITHNNDYFVILLKEDSVNGLLISKNLIDWSFIDLSFYSSITCIANVFDKIWFCTEDGENRLYSLNIEYLLNSSSTNNANSGVSLDSPAFTGIPTTPTPETDNESNQIVNIQYVQNVLSNSPFLGGTPMAPIASIQTENNEIAATKYVANKLREYSNSPAFTGTPTTPTPVSGGPSEQIANTAYVVNELNIFGKGMMQEVSLNVKTTLKNSPTLGGIPVAPTAEKGTSTTQIATTEFVANTVGESATLGGKYWEKNLFGTDDLESFHCIKYLNDKFIAVTNISRKYSYDGLNWIECDSIPVMNSMAYGNGLYVGYNNSEKKFYNSLDGINWTGVVSEQAAYAFSIDFCNTMFIICGSNGCMKSNNGLVWETITVPTTDINGKVYTYRKAVYGNGMYNILADSFVNSVRGYYLLSSQDLLTWSAIDLPWGYDRSEVDMICANGKIIITGETICYNTEGADWEDLSTWTVKIVYPDYLFAPICQGNGVFIIMNNTGDVLAYSTDVINWYLVDHKEKFGYGLSLSGCAYGNGVFICYGHDNNNKPVILSSKVACLQNSNKETFSTTGLVSNVINLLNNKTGYIVSENDLVAPYTLKTGALYFYCVYTNGVPTITKVYFGINDVGYLMISNVT